MEKYFALYLISSSILIIFLLHTLNNLKKGLIETVKLAAKASAEANFNSVKLAKYIIIDLSQKSKERDLTPEEQDFFHESRKFIYEFEQMVKTQVS
jgi:hypothetical protein